MGASSIRTHSPDATDLPSIHHYFAAKHRVWEPYRFVERDTISVTELWADYCSDNGGNTNAKPTTYRVISREVYNYEVSDWLDTTSTSHSTPGGLSARSSRCVLRAAWVAMRKEHHSRISVDVERAAFEQLAGAFGLELAQRTVRSAYATIARLDDDNNDDGPKDEKTQLQSYVFSQHPKLSLTWSTPSSSPVPSAFGSATHHLPTSLICIALPSKIEAFQDLLNHSFAQRLFACRQRTRALAPALACALLYSREIDQRIGYAKRLVREVEARTGHHDFETRRHELPAAGDLFALAARMSGCGTKMASHACKVGILEQLGAFVREQVGLEEKAAEFEEDQEPRWREGVRARGEDEEGEMRIRRRRRSEAVAFRGELLDDLAAIERRLAVQKIDAAYVECRVRTQRDALFHLISEHDAATGHEMAKDSKVLALAAQRDSSSMKSLAVVSMLFLPGTFVASLFGMPLFDWDAGGASSFAEQHNVRVWGPRLGLFLAVTLPLMLATFIVWLLWMRRQKRMRAKKYAAARGGRRPEHPQMSTVPTSEVRALALKHVNSTLSEESIVSADD